MKKAFAFIASEKKGNSNTYKYANMILENVRDNYNGSIGIELMVSGIDEVKKCKGCRRCFSCGECPLDEEDCMDEIKQKMLDADVIILGCGVYFQHISSEMKNFVDRLSYWAHVFRLAGKQCVILTTSGSNGNEYAEAYLKRVSLSLGMQVIGTSFCRVEYPRELSDYGLIKERIRLISDVILKALDEQVEKKSNDFQERLYASMKEIYRTHPEFRNEIDIWEKNGLFGCDSFQQVMNMGMD